jgi:Zn-dependent protease
MDPHLFEALREGLIFYIILAASIALHEYGHAKAADLLGDYLPRTQGRVTLNPIAHLDPIGTVLIPLLMIFGPLLIHSRVFAVGLIGWGRPVQIALNDPKTRVRNEILITLAGPGMNFLIALAAGIAGGLTQRFHGGDTRWADVIIGLNCSLIAFNLIPLPPLDGSRIIRHIVGMSEEMFVRLASISPVILLILVNTSILNRPMSFVANLAATPIYYCMERLAGGSF